MAIKDWKVKTIKSGKIWNSNKHTGFLYLYNKGFFRNREDKYVIKSSQTGGSYPADRKCKFFKTKAQALKYATNYRKKK